MVSVHLFSMLHWLMKARRVSMMLTKTGRGMIDPRPGVKYARRESWVSVETYPVDCAQMTWITFALPHRSEKRSPLISM